MSGVRRSTLAFLAVALGLVTAGPAAAAPGFGRASVDRDPQTGTVGFAGVRAGQEGIRPAGVAAGASPAAVGRAYLEDHAGAFGLRGGSTLAVARREPQPGGLTAVRYQQSLNGVPVLGGELTVTVDDEGGVRTVLGEAEPAATIDADPRLSAGQAEDAAVADVAKDEGVDASALRAGGTALRVFDPRIMGGPGLQRATLAWATTVTDGGAVKRLVLVDATAGAVLAAIDQIHAAKTRAVCDATNTRSADDRCELGGRTPLRTEQGPAYAGPVADVNKAFDLSGVTYDFFASRFGRDSLDGAGLPLRSTVRYCKATGACPYQNAYWNGRQMVYGDTFTSADDVVGHELSHGLTDFTSSLFYYYQSGAINESLSDVFGELIDQDHVTASDTDGTRWKLGEDLPIGAIRDMKNPPAFNDPDKMTSPLYDADVDEGDSGGVHHNSGVNNKAAFLISDGGEFGITGLGLTKTARLYYTVETSFLGSASDYADLANALEGACSNLATAGTDGFTAADCTQVAKAVAATEMRKDPTVIGAAAVDQPLCGAGQPGPAWVTFDDMETDPASRWTAVGDWYAPQPLAHPWVGDATYASSGTHELFGWDRSSIADYAIRSASAVTVPAGAKLTLQTAWGFDDETRAGFPYAVYDGGLIEYSIDGGVTWSDVDPSVYTGTVSSGYGNPLGGRAALTGESGGYRRLALPLPGSTAGASVLVRFRIGTDNSVADYGWFIDDVGLYSCAAVDTSIAAGPADGSSDTSTTPTFALSGNVGPSYECSLDGAPFASCPATVTTPALAPGQHTFAARAVDARGTRDATPAVRTWTVVTPPTGGGGGGNAQGGGGAAASGGTTPGGGVAGVVAQGGGKPAVKGAKQRGGTVAFSLTAPGAGRLAVTGKVKKVKLSASTTVKAAGPATVKLKLSKKARKGLKKRARKLPFVVTFTPAAGGAPTTTTVKVALKR